MKPYYEDESVMLFLGDCRDVLPALDIVDHVLTDPPYARDVYQRLQSPNAHKRFRDDMHAYFRALIIVLDMTGNASTHAEKNARLRGAIELLERMVEQLRGRDLEIIFSHYRWADAFASDFPTRRMMDRIHELESEIASLKQPPAAPEESAEYPI